MSEIDNIKYYGVTFDKKDISKVEKSSTGKSIEVTLKNKVTIVLNESHEKQNNAHQASIDLLDDNTTLNCSNLFGLFITDNGKESGKDYNYQLNNCDTSTHLYVRKDVSRKAVWYKNPIEWLMDIDITKGIDSDNITISNKKPGVKPKISFNKGDIINGQIMDHSYTAD